MDEPDMGDEGILVTYGGVSLYVCPWGWQVGYPWEVCNRNEGWSEYFTTFNDAMAFAGRKLLE